MRQKYIMACIYLKEGQAVKSIKDMTPVGDVMELAKFYNDCGIDKVLVFDLSDNDKEHDLHIHIIKEMCRILEIPVLAGGNLNRLEDLKKLLYAGCKKVMLNSSKPVTADLAEEGSKRFGKEKMALSLENVDILFKHREAMEENISEMFVINESIVDTISNVTQMPYAVIQAKYNLDRWTQLLKQDEITGIFGEYLYQEETDIMDIKAQLSANGVNMSQLTSSMNFDDFKVNEDGLLPVIVQDYETQEVLMLAYMNKESYEMTLASGKMTYYSRSRKKLWVKGETSGHYQYVKALMIDCDNDTILAKVSQVGVACHTGSKSCFFTELTSRDYTEKNPFKVFESTYSVIADRKLHPKEGSYTNYLFDKGIDKILKKVGEEATEIVIAAKNPDAEELKYEISDFLYHAMVLMVEKGVTWEDIAQELAQR